MPIAEFPGHRDWGYDGVFLYAPSSQYGRPDDLKQLVEACHARGLAIFLDVVYNHFGPEGNYLPAIAPDFFTDRHQTPWGAAIDFSGPDSRPVRDFFIATLSIGSKSSTSTGCASMRSTRSSTRATPTSSANSARRSAATSSIAKFISSSKTTTIRPVICAAAGIGSAGFNAQWNDDLHHVLHVLATGDASGYYADYAVEPARHLGRALGRGLGLSGGAFAVSRRKPRGEPSGELPPTAFVGFLQNHDQVGNHPFGTRIAARAEEAALHAAIAIVLLSPQIPLLFMGEEWASKRPFAFFCDFEPGLRDAVREGRRRGILSFPRISGRGGARADPRPDRASSTFEMSRLDWSEPGQEPHSGWLGPIPPTASRSGLREIVPRLAGMPPYAGSYQVLGPKAVRVEWRLGDGSRLRLLANFGDSPASRNRPKENWFIRLPSRGRLSARPFS